MSKLNGKLFQHLRQSIPHPQPDCWGEKESVHVWKHLAAMAKRATKAQLLKVFLARQGATYLQDVMGETIPPYVHDSSEYDARVAAWRAKHELVNAAELQWLAGDSVAAKELIEKVLG